MAQREIGRTFITGPPPPLLSSLLQFIPLDLIVDYGKYWGHVTELVSKIRENIWGPFEVSIFFKNSAVSTLLLESFRQLISNRGPTQMFSVLSAGGLTMFRQRKTSNDDGTTNTLIYPFHKTLIGLVTNG